MGCMIKKWGSWDMQSLYFRLISFSWKSNKPSASFHLACAWICIMQIKKHLMRNRRLEFRYLMLLVKQIYWAAKQIT